MVFLLLPTKFKIELQREVEVLLVLKDRTRVAAYIQILIESITYWMLLLMDRSRLYSCDGGGNPKNVYCIFPKYIISIIFSSNHIMIGAIAPKLWLFIKPLIAPPAQLNIDFRTFTVEYIVCNCSHKGR